MLQVVLQIAAAFALLVGALRIRHSLRQRLKRDWIMILERLSGGDGALSELSYSAVASEDLTCAPHEIWSKLNGVRGLWVMYRNLEVLHEAIDFVARQTLDDLSACIRIGRLRTDTMNAQLSLARTALMALAMCGRRPPPAQVATSTKQYLESVARFGLILNDFRPELLRTYRHSINKH